MRTGFGPETLMTTASDHVALRTPTRPAFWPGNALHLLRTPTELAPWLDRFDRSVGQLPGVTRRVVSWEVDGVGERPGVAVPDGAVVHHPVAMELGTLADVDVADDLELVAASDDRHWAGAKVLYLQTDWEGDERHWRWLVGQQRAVVEAGRARVLVAYRYGIPVGRGALFHDRGGLALVDDVITHPLYRGQGVATALVHRLVADHLADHPDDRVVVVADRDEPAERVYRRLGFAAVSTVWSVVA
jgi:GNAT superfamily N-acetyltransferase